MADSEPTHDNPRNTRNLPAVVPQGEVLRPVQTVGIVFVLAAIVIVHRPSRLGVEEESAAVDPIE